MQELPHPSCSFPLAEVQQHAEAELGSLAKEEGQEVHMWEVLGLQANMTFAILSSPLLEWGR